MQSLSAADAGNRQDATKTADGIDIGTAHSSTSDLHRDDPRSAEQIANRSPNDKLVKYVNSALQRKPPEYVGYAVNADSDVDARRPSTKPNKYLTTISIGTGDATRRKTNDSKLPYDGGLHGYGWTADKDGVWRAATGGRRTKTGCENGYWWTADEDGVWTAATGGRRTKTGCGERRAEFLLTSQSTCRGDQSL